MKDRDFLLWIHGRLTHVHGEDPQVDYMRKLRAIIAATPTTQETPNTETLPTLGPVQKRVREDLAREAFALLQLIDAEWQSDPMSTQCFDSRTITRVRALLSAFDWYTLPSERKDSPYA